MSYNRHPGISWDWTPETWAWSPDRERWRPEHGAPGECVHLEVTTEGIETTDAYDFWRETVFYNFCADPPDSDTDIEFKARADALIAARGEFYAYESDAISGARTHRQVRSDDAEGIDLGLVLAGERRHRESAGEHMAQVGTLFFYDAAHSSQVRWSPHRGAHLSLRREEVVAAIGGDVPSATLVSKALADSALAPFLRAQLELFSRRIHLLSNVERALLLDSTIDLALSVLRSVAGPLAGSATPRRNNLFVAAKTLIARRLTDPDLDAVAIAERLGCSRATLYRAFADQGLTVSEYIREERLQRAMNSLRMIGRKVQIAQLAQEVGFRDPSNFGRAFRQRFGVNPSAVRGTFA